MYLVPKSIYIYISHTNANDIVYYTYIYSRYTYRTNALLIKLENSAVWDHSHRRLSFTIIFSNKCCKLIYLIYILF